MSEVLNTVNHTTLEALGFKYQGEQTTFRYDLKYKMLSNKQDEPTLTTITEDVFEYEDLKVLISEHGTFLQSTKHVRTNISLGVLKAIIAEKKAA
nr:hypothetical protein [Mucilaginibacter sp. L294]